MIHETSLGWTRYTPRIYLSYVVMLLLNNVVFCFETLYDNLVIEMKFEFN
ncbi:hypothetical protein Hanom_Chr10g00923961 [Helianthus anomalus]